MGFIPPILFFRVLFSILQQLLGVFCVLLFIPLFLSFPYAWTAGLSLKFAVSEVYAAAFQVGEQAHHFSKPGGRVFQLFCEIIYLLVTGLVVATSVMAITKAAEIYKNEMDKRNG